MTNLIYKYLNDKATEKEVALVFEWIEKSEENKNQFVALKKLWSITTISNKKNSYRWSKIKNQLHKSPKKKSLPYIKYAVGFSFIIAFFIIFHFKSEENIISKNQITLETNNGKKEVLLENKTKVIEDNLGNVIAKQTDNEIVYFKQTETDKVVYNTIKVPYSKTFKVTLADGTIVRLNAGTTFTYPEQFRLNSERTVILEGEAFFEVAKDENRPFIVNANEVTVQVLGTSFNISSYVEDGFTSCVLVEGSVKLSENNNKKNSILLTPNEKSTWQIASKTFETQKVTTNYYTSWINGELVFKNTPFSTIAKKIERYYDVKIINENSFLAAQVFTGTIKIKESTVADILAIFKIDTPFEYQQKEKTFQILTP
jgi:transmembrane sensor